MAANTELPAGFEKLWARYPWPAGPPVPDAPMVGRDSAGFDLLHSALSARAKACPVIVELGAEFGGSTRKFLSEPNTYVISVDPWPDTYGGGSFPALQPFLGGTDGMYKLFQTFNFDLKERLATVREYSPAGPLVVRDAGVDVDLIYIDGDHRYDAVYRDLDVTSAMFPDAMLSGDDWLFAPRAAKYEGMKLPVQSAVTRWAWFNGAHIEVDGNTWLLDKSRPFNLKRPSFYPVRRAGSETSVPADSAGQLIQSLETINRSLGRIDRAIQSTPGRRVLRKARSLMSRTN